MPTFALEKLEAIKDDGHLSFYKVSIDGICQFNKFCAEIAKSPEDQKKLKKIYAYMNHMSESNGMLPKKKFNSIQNKQKVFGHEFKDDNLRVYVLKKDPNIFIILGGYKKNQNKDIGTLLEIIELDGFLEFAEKFNTEGN